MRKFTGVILAALVAVSLAACGSDKQSESILQSEAKQEEIKQEEIKQEESKPDEVSSSTGGKQAKADSEQKKALVVYFSQPETTDGENMTTDEENSVVVVDGEVMGNTQYMAYVIQENTNADIFRIEPEVPYPAEHDALVDQASEEQENKARPAINEQIENFEDYTTVYIGYPIWWSDMPMLLYTLFEDYDFSGKTIIPFSTHGGSGLAGTVSEIQELEPTATVFEDALSISRDDIVDAEREIADWINGIN